MDYITNEFEEYTSPLTGEVIKFNPSSRAFCILKTPTKEEFNELLQEYVNAKIQITWRELLEPLNKDLSKINGDRIRLFAATKASGSDKKFMPTYIFADSYTKAIGEETSYQCHLKVESFSIEEQKKLAEAIKPNSLEEAKSLFKEGSFHHNDALGYRFIDEVIKPQDNFTEAVNAMASLLNEVVADSGIKSKRFRLQHSNKTPRNTLELLSFLHAKGYVLFPYVRKLSEDPFEYWMLHKNNVRHCEYPELVNPDAYEFVNRIHQASEASRANKRLGSNAKTMVKASTFTRIEQISDELLDRQVELYEENYQTSSSSETATRTNGSAFNAYTNMCRDIFNSKHNNPALKLKHRKYMRKTKKTIYELADFSLYSDKLPELKIWTELLSQYCLSINDTQFQLRISSARYFLDWLSGLEHIPQSPLEIVRTIHVNDYAEGNTLRNHLKNRYSLKASNRHLSMYRQFFDFCHDTLYKNPDNRESLSTFVNPVDTKWDRFAEGSSPGSKRTPIESRIMNEIRNLIIEDDYAFPKKAFSFSYVHLTNHETGEYEHNVFCPSVANLLYFMLWIPIRKIQAQLLDSGEGDDFIYDFDLEKFVKNENKIGNEKRQEGLLQTLPSGVLGITDVLGLHITTNKTSDDGYDIPWVCDELLASLKNQYQWLRKYSPYPERRGKDSLGKLLTEESIMTDKTFYCLFRDPSQQRSDDQSKPVATHIITKAWGLLCNEAEKRINRKLPETHRKISLTKEGAPTESRYDIHTLRVSGITDLLDKGVPLGIVQKFVAGHKTYMMTLHYDNPSHAKVREYLEAARTKDSNVSDFEFIESEIDQVIEHFVTNQAYANNKYTAFDALKKNAGIVSIKLSGICPGASCEEGGLDPYKKTGVPVPVGDRGPSCPQCRFWITGPMFLLGQVVEGNQLIRKIKKKVIAIDKIRESIIDAEDNGNTQLYNKLSGREDRELRILSNMLTEWSERMKFYEASVRKLDAWIAYKDKNHEENSSLPISMFSKSTEEEIRYGFSQSSNLELTHFLSTVSEFLPEFIDSDDTSVPDLEQAIARFMAMNNLGDILFKLNDEQRLQATNLMTDALISNVGAECAENLLNGDVALSEFPELSRQVIELVSKSEEKIFRLDANTFESIGSN
ncbi:VPA1269 family protein [Vibrio alginolyticus]|uniref:VPA1269 family protein n=1 Tax=Vibrio alginolyticus TaxID=663 RepID=UPI00215BDCC2|nr:VPA1269 family protein [Vibrio alginolyticus]MCR9338286.1 VPA1269 family protein [Vibrio alginolyticus]MCR9341594.1 VPA1269 family protein [Vibrio alginolyticus]